MLKTLSKIESLAMIAEDMERSGEHGLEAFKKSFAQDPLYAFEWGQSAVEVAARLRVGREVKAWIEN